MTTREEAEALNAWLRQMEGRVPTEPRIQAVSQEEKDKQEAERERNSWEKFALGMMIMQMVILLAVLVNLGVLLWVVLTMPLAAP